MPAIPNGEKIVADYLRTIAGVPRVVNKTPRDQGTAWVHLTQLNAPSETSADYLIRFLFQLDCYAGDSGGRPEASALAIVVRAALEQMPDAALDGAVVSKTRNIGHASNPDEVFDPDRERIILSQYVWMHDVAT